MIEDWMVLPFSEEQRGEFRNGGWRPWVRKYPKLFDERDARNAAGQAARGYHFFEWLAAIVIFEQMGYRSLLAKYHFRAHLEKIEQFRRRVPGGVVDLFAQPRRFGRTQGPDLFAYHDNGDWFFCEVKGPRDQLRPTQEAFFGALEDVSQRSVRLVRFFRLPGRGEGA